MYYMAMEPTANFLLVSQSSRSEYLLSVTPLTRGRPLWSGLAADDAAKAWVFAEQILEEDCMVGEL